MISYFDELQVLAADLQIEEFVNWHGLLSDQDVDNLYQQADVFLCMSEHEGFCVPLIGLNLLDSLSLLVMQVLYPKLWGKNRWLQNLL